MHEGWIRRNLPPERPPTGAAPPRRPVPRGQPAGPEVALTLTATCRVPGFARSAQVAQGQASSSQMRRGSTLPRAADPGRVTCIAAGRTPLPRWLLSLWLLTHGGRLLGPCNPRPAFAQGGRLLRTKGAVRHCAASGGPSATSPVSVTLVLSDAATVNGALNKGRKGRSKRGEREGYPR